MAKSKKKLRQEKKNKAEAKQFWTISIIVVAVLLVLLYFVYANS